MERTLLKAIIIFLSKCYGKIMYQFHNLYIFMEKQKLGYCGKNVIVKYPNHLSEKIFLYDNVYIYEYAKFIIGPSGKFVMKKNAGASQGLTVITGKHGHIIGHWFLYSMRTRELDKESSIIVEEDVRLGANVTLMPDVTIGRGAQIGACAVVTKNIPPYAIAVGNPAKVIKFIFTPEEIIEHEVSLYPINERLDIETMRKMQSFYLG